MNGVTAWQRMVNEEIKLVLLWVFFVLGLVKVKNSTFLG